MKKTWLVCALFLMPALSLDLTAADKTSTVEKLHVDYNIPLWPDGKVPGAVGNWAVDKPYLTVVLPPEGKGNGSAVIICPGGGNTTLFAHQEGMSIAEHMNAWGVAGFVLSYRLGPRYKQDARTMDGRRAVQLLRARAAEFKIDPKRGDLQTHSNASPYGAYDMAGSLFEWCSDWYSRNYYSFSPRKNPQGPQSGAYRVLRGAACYMEPWELRAANRSSGGSSNQRHNLIGFRCARNR